MPKQVGNITLYPLPELADLLGVTVTTLRQYVKDGKLKARKIGYTYHVTEEELKEFLDNQQRK